MNLSTVIAGEYVIYEGRTLLIEEDKSLSCKGCIFENKPCQNDCLGCFRTDQTNVIFKQVDV